MTLATANKEFENTVYFNLMSVWKFHNNYQINSKDLILLQINLKKLKNKYLCIGHSLQPSESSTDRLLWSQMSLGQSESRGVTAYFFLPLWVINAFSHFSPDAVSGSGGIILSTSVGSYYDLEVKEKSSLLYHNISKKIILVFYETGNTGDWSRFYFFYFFCKHFCHRKDIFFPYNLFAT